MISTRITVIDNYDSFTYNLVQLLGLLGAELTIFRNDEITVSALKKRLQLMDGLLISPGPGTPSDAGISKAAIKALSGKIPILGVCLGHQSLAEVFGGEVCRADQILHGKTSLMLHTGRGVFEGIQNPFPATRYHSLIVTREGLPNCFKVQAWTADDELMAIKHKTHESWGVQFHPESILTSAGKQLMQNFIHICQSAKAEAK